MKYESEEAGRLRAALAAAEAGLLMRREYYRRLHPTASESELDRMVSEWILARHESELTIPGFRRRAIPVQ